jgi:hypothetical protein
MRKLQNQWNEGLGEVEKIVLFYEIVDIDPS